MSSLATSSADPDPFRVLVADAVYQRTNLFLIQGGPSRMKIIRTEREAKEQLNDSNWDVLLTSLYLGDWNQPLQLIEPVTKAFKEKRLRLVICYTPILKDATAFVKELRKRGVPAVWYPHNYTNPSLHARVEV